MTKEAIFSKLKEILINDFDIEEDLITLEASISEDLDLDSIDSVELIVKVRPYLKDKIEPEEFKSVKTVQDVVDLLEPLSI
ncbi:MAG: acyl carrier protein [Treponema sp.]|uniref:acyl carrier protein n=1 Tax=Treponema sp. TaxID=166 RepID=UPI0025ED9C5D|nr:acyl carrier protein [Treponema sp.]MBQ9623305.1 acyl carrier protein [Treponema sp.]MBR0496190.1 acyl carrier protein [Treponema sp.]